MVVNDTLEAKKSLNEAGIGISVVADVLATICYLTPSQAHFTDAGDFVQLSILSIWIFRITKCASIFFAIASIMVAMPKPWKRINEEWQCNQESIEIAMGLLGISIYGMLIAFIVVSCAAPIFYVVVVGSMLCVKDKLVNNVLLKAFISRKCDD